MPRFTEPERQALLNKMNAHEKALIQMGFLVTREVAAGPNDYTAVMELNTKEATEGYASGHLVRVDPFGTGVVIALTAPLKDISNWENVVRKASSKPTIIHDLSTP